MNANPARSRPPAGLGGRRLDGADAGQCRRRADERQRVEQQGTRGGQQGHQESGEALPAHVRHRPAAVQQRGALHILLGRHHRHEQRAVRDEEQHVEGTDPERDQVELREAEDAEQVRDRDRRGEDGPREVGDQHGAAALPPPVDPGAGQHREQQARQQCGGGEVAHLGGVRVQDEHGRQGYGQQGDLVAEQRHGLPGPEPAERRLAEQIGNPPRHRPADRSGPRCAAR
jgi:hypothetical protein